MATHKDLEAWNLSVDLVVEVYELTRTFPSDEKFGLISQMRRCAISIPSNIAEGSARKSNTQYLQFLNIALGSLAELDTQFIIAERLNYLDAQNQFEKISLIRSKLINLIKYLKNLPNKPTH